ncbi:GTPase Era [Oceanidesulfovibrio marinus]|nr:GTPase Era [Oceanidesulfovibrio marinus]
MNDDTYPNDEYSEDEDGFSPDDLEFDPENFDPEALPGREIAMPLDIEVPEGFRAGWVALLGPPNAGKSTLLNALVGQKVAIVTSKPQTTRTQVTGILSREMEQLVFFDTPGLHNRGGKMNRALLQSAWQALSGADVVVLVLDMAFAASRTAAFMDEVRDLAEPLLESDRPLLLALNKVDIVKPKDALLPIMEELADAFPGASLYPISALRTEGLPPLLDGMIEHLPESPPLFPPDQVSTAPMRFMASELLREKLFDATRQEVPYSLAVDIEEWFEDPDTGRISISAVVYVARQAHKRIVIGKDGRVLKEAATKTRHELMDMLGRKVHLEVWVKVKENWPENPAMLRQLGLG